ncbi:MULTISPECIES: hypothetical protein [unclassified Bradyrhizobium]
MLSRASAHELAGIARALDTPAPDAHHGACHELGAMDLMLGVVIGRPELVRFRVPPAGPEDMRKRLLNRGAVRRHRERRKGRNKRAVAPVEYDGAVVDALEDWGYLPRNEAHSSKDVGQAIARAISEAARSGK